MGHIFTFSFIFVGLMDFDQTGIFCFQSLSNFLVYERTGLRSFSEKND